MKLINFKGEVVTPMYDCEFFADWIERGVICPSSRLISQFDAVADGEDVTVFVDSPGGDVFAGDAIIIAAANAKKRCGAFTVEVGSEACSMGAFFVAAMKVAGATIRCHSNSKVMFHSATVGVQGGEELLKDRAELVKMINANAKANLAALGVTDTDDWFAEGREKWLGADELKTCGLVDEVIEAAAEEIDISDSVTAFRAAALKKAEADASANWEARFKGASKKINAITAERDAIKGQFDSFVEMAAADAAAAAKNFNVQLDALKEDLAVATAKVSELSAALDEKAKALKAKEEELGLTADALAKANEHVARLESARQLLTAGVLTPSAESSYDEQMRLAKTPEQREALRSKKAVGKIK